MNFFAKLFKGISKRAWISLGLAVVLFVSGLLAFVIIPNINSRFKPVSAWPGSVNTVSGNGTNAVMVGEYLYFIGSFKASAEIEYKENTYNKVTEGAIYRVKLTNGIPTYDNGRIADEDDEYNPALPESINSEKYGEWWNSYVDNMELIVPKIAGHERAALWVFDTYLVYSSPNTNKNKYGLLQTNLLDFFRVDLNGANNKLIYTTKTINLDKENYTVADLATRGSSGALTHNIYLLVNDGGKLVRVGVNSNPGKVTTIAESVTSFAFPVVSSYSERGFWDGTEWRESTSSLITSYYGSNKNSVMQYVYYTSAYDEDEETSEQGNLLKRFHISNGENVTLSNASRKVHQVINLSGGSLMFQVGDWTPSGISNNVLYVTSNKDESGFKVDGNLYLSQATDVYDESETFYAPTESMGSVQFKFLSLVGTDLYLYEKYADGKADIYGNYYKVGSSKLASGVSSIISVNSNNIYFMENDVVRMIDFSCNGRDLDRGNRSEREVSVKVSTFTAMDEFGQFVTGGERYFYMKKLSQTDGETDSNGNVISITVPVISDLNGKTYILGRIDEKFLPEFKIY